MDENVLRLVKEHEGLSLYAYPDSLTYWSIGYGRCIDRRKNCGITQEEAEYLLLNDLNKAESQLKHFEWFNELDAVRQGVIIELTFNIGLSSVLKFVAMIAYIEKKDFNNASSEMLNSQWSKQVGIDRSENMANRMRSGHY